MSRICTKDEWGWKSERASGGCLYQTQHEPRGDLGADGRGLSSQDLLVLFSCRPTRVDSAAHIISAIRWTKRPKATETITSVYTYWEKWPKTECIKNIHIHSRHCVLVSIYKTMQIFPVNNQAHKMILLMRLHWRYWKWIHVKQALRKLETVRIFQ